MIAVVRIKSRCFLPLSGKHFDWFLYDYLFYISPEANEHLL